MIKKIANDSNKRYNRRREIHKMRQSAGCDQHPTLLLYVIRPHTQGHLSHRQTYYTTVPAITQVVIGLFVIRKDEKSEQVYVVSISPAFCISLQNEVRGEWC